MNLDEIIKSMQSLQEEVAKNTESIEQLSQVIDSTQAELDQCDKAEEDELESIRNKYREKRANLTATLSELTAKKQLIETSGASLKLSVGVIEALFRKQQECVPKEDVKAGIDTLKEKFAASSFESTGEGLDDLCSDDFIDIERELGIDDIVDTEIPAEEDAA